jgi:hypothetical protein
MAEGYLRSSNEVTIASDGRWRMQTEGRAYYGSILTKLGKPKAVNWQLKRSIYLQRKKVYILRRARVVYGTKTFPK